MQAARAIWALRERFPVEYPPPAEAIARASEAVAFPVVVNETSDNPGGGAPGDGTHLLRALLDARPEGAVFCGICDAAVVQQAHAAGVGATISVSLGGKTDSAARRSDRMQRLREGADRRRDGARGPDRPRMALPARARPRSC